MKWYQVGLFLVCEGCSGISVYLNVVNHANIEERKGKVIHVGTSFVERTGGRVRNNERNLLLLGYVLYMICFQFLS